MHDSIIFLDTETTGKEEQDRLCQVAYSIGELDRCELFRPPVPIGFGAMAIHHITNEMVEHKPPFLNSFDYTVLSSAAESGILCCHNTPFDAEMLRREGLEFPKKIDTLKLIRHLDTTCQYESHSLQYLRYAMGFKINAAAHDARGDVLVLKLLAAACMAQLQDNLGTDLEETIQEAMRITSNPVRIRKIGFGKHKGELVEDVAKTDRGYLKWLQREKLLEPERDEDWIYTLNHYLT